MNALAEALNSQAGAALRRGDPGEAERLYRRAGEADPGALEPAINLAIVLDHQSRPGDATALLQAREADGAGSARYWSARAAAERGAGDLASAAASYENCLALDPGHDRARHGRARVALERGETTMVERFAALAEGGKADAQVWLGYAQALDCAGEAGQAQAIAEALVAQAPGWPDALELLAQLRLAQGAPVDAHYRDAVANAADPHAAYTSWCRVLAGLDRFTEAADVAREARPRFADNPELALAEAVHAGAAGDDKRADAIFAALALDSPARDMHEARHRLRQGDPERAEALLERALQTEPGNITCWALRGVAWRLLADPRGAWLHGQEGLVAALDLDLDDAALTAVIAVLDSLHDASAEPIGQSLRGGTQTRGALLTRWEPELAALARSLEEAIGRYQRALPPADPAHPLLRHRDAAWRIVGSWSVRLASAGRHVAHIHPLGIVSSAAYFALPPPDPADPLAGTLELGRPPADLRLDLPPLTRIEPRVGRLALFPSTLYHGTQTFARGRRMTVAFDVGLTR